MAELAVKSATDWLGKLLIEEGTFLWGAEGKLEELRDELLWMQSFLRDADTIQHDHEIVRLWLFQIKEYASEAEDIIEEFVIKIASRRREKDWKNTLKRRSLFIGELISLHKVASKIESLKAKIATLSPKLAKYELKQSYGATMSTYCPSRPPREALNEQVQVQSLRNIHLEDNKNTVGLESEVDEVVAALKSSSRANRGVVAIYGMDGLGKTTLAMRVFYHREIFEHFNGNLAWVYIGSQFRWQNVLRKLIEDLTHISSEVTSEMTERELASALHQYMLQKKCLVVLDDPRTKNVLTDLIKTTSHGMNSGSKILLTTRKEEVAREVDHDALHRPNPLPKDKAWELLRKIIERPKIDDAEKNKSSDTSTNQSAGRDGSINTTNDPEMISLGKKMVDHCNGLPLAIVVLGGILRKKETLEEWQHIHKNITSYLRRGTDRGRSYTKVLLQSYNELPYHLKPCFLHLGNFPEDSEIDANKLYWMWMAEDLVTRPSDTVMGTESLEDVGNEYLIDLAQSGVIEVVKKESNGMVKSIRMHDLMRDVCLQKAAVENFLSMIDHRRCSHKPLYISPYFSHKRLLRMAVYLAPEVKSFIPHYLSSKSHKYLRSLSFIAGHEVGEGRDKELMDEICKRFEWLRVLDLERFYLQGTLTKQIQNLIHLRYLSLKETRVSKLPSSIGNLRFLLVLDLRVSSDVSSVKIPRSLCKLDKLRRLLLPFVPYEVISRTRSKTKLRVDTFIYLETLENLQVSDLEEDGMEKLQNLRKLSTKDVVTTKKTFDSIILRSGRLQSCSIGVHASVISEDSSPLSSCDCIQSLNLVGPISHAIAAMAFPRSLKELCLEGCKLGDDPMKILGKLYYLSVLTLDVDSYVGTEMTCESDGFPLLTTLTLRRLTNLKSWRLLQKSMTKLQRLTIRDCSKLRNIPIGLPSSLEVTCLPCVSGVEKYGTCSFSIVSHQKHFVQLYDYSNWLVKPLTEKNGKYRKFLLHGKGGIGKATNAKGIYHSSEIRQHFKAFAWACLPRKCSAHLPKRILQAIVRDLDPKKSREELSKKSHEDLIESLCNVMNTTKSLVVLINLHEFDLVQLDKTFRGECFETGSKLVITSNKEHPSTDYLHVEKIRSLTKEQSWELLYNILHRQIDELNKNPVEWKKAAIENPLAVNMFGGMLSMKETSKQWGHMLREVNGCRLVDFEWILRLCYEDLPRHLISCLLSLSMFPEELEMSTKKLYHMWIAAGFVKFKDDDGIEAAEFLENLAESYLVELVQRGMVRVGKRGPSGKIRKCQLQFGLWEFCKSKAEQHFQGQATFPVYKYYQQEEEQMCDMLCRLNSPREVEELSELRYFSLKGANVKTLPSSIEKLTNLQTLDLRVMECLSIPDVLWKLKSLRHLYLPTDFIVEQQQEQEQQQQQQQELQQQQQRTTKLKLQGLDNLRTLFNLQSDQVELSHVQLLEHVKKISIRKIQVNEMLKSEVDTSLDLSVYSEVINSRSSILSSLQNLPNKLRIKGKIEIQLTPQIFPVHLRELQLKHTKLEQDPLPSLETLTELRSLFLDQESFTKTTMKFPKGLAKLTHLMLRSLTNLEQLDRSEGGVPNLESILVTNCWRLEIEKVKLKFPKSGIMVEN